MFSYDSSAGMLQIKRVPSDGDGDLGYPSLFHF